MGLLTASSALYGFVIAYYAFARLRQGQEEWQIKTQARREKWTFREGAKAQQRVRFRRLWLNTFTLASSFVYFITALGLFFFLVSGIFGGLVISAWSFLLFIGLVVTFFVGVTLANLLETWNLYSRTKEELAASDASRGEEVGQSKMKEE